jgi:very-short-patch-repair endonuclease
MTNELDVQVARIAAMNHGVFAMHHLRELGATRDERLWRVATGRWESLYDGAFRVAGAPVTWRGRLLAACWAGGERSVASHRSAAALWGLPNGREDLLEISCHRWRRARHAGVLVHESMRLEPADLTVVDGVPCVSIERTIFDSCSFVKRSVAHLMIDAALRRQLTDTARLTQTLHRLATRGRRGVALYRSVLEERQDAQALPGSEPERVLALALVGQGLPEPVMQYVVRGPAGEFVARVDLAYPAERVLIEYESYQEHTGKVALDRDSARRNAMVALGFTVLTATQVDLRDRAQALASAVRRLRAAASSATRDELAS